MLFVKRIRGVFNEWRVMKLTDIRRQKLEREGHAEFAVGGSLPYP